MAANMPSPTNYVLRSVLSPAAVLSVLSALHIVSSMRADLFGTITAENLEGKQWVVECEKSRVELSRVAYYDKNNIISGLRVTKHKELGKGRDAQHHPTSYNDLELIEAYYPFHPEVMVEGSESFAMGIRADYDMERDAMWDERQFINKVATFMDDKVGSLLNDGLVGPAINEKILLHGTKAEFVEPILCSFLSKGGGIFGNGVYLTDMPEKSDQYATSYATSDGEEDIFFTFMVSALLGEPAYVYCNKTGREVKFFQVDNVRGDHEIVPVYKDYEKGPRRFFFQNVVTRDLFHSLKGLANFVPDDKKILGPNRKSCIDRFSEYILPPDSRRVIVKYVLQYERLIRARNGSST